MIKNEDVVFNFTDIEKNECWICNNNPEKWHIWKPCKHAYCNLCSEKMVEMKMTCPLCRNAIIGIDSHPKLT